MKLWANKGQPLEIPGSFASEPHALAATLKKLSRIASYIVINGELSRSLDIAVRTVEQDKRYSVSRFEDGETYIEVNEGEED